MSFAKPKTANSSTSISRQYLSSSLLAGAIGKAFSSALKGVCHDKPFLVDKEYDFEIRISNFSCRINPGFIEKIFVPLGYTLEWESLAKERTHFSGSSYGNLNLNVHATLQNTLSHLYILFPVFDRQMHFWLGESQLQKFIRHSQNWLGSHSEKRLIINEYFWPASELKYRAMECFGALRSQDGSSLSPTLNQMRQSAIETVLTTNAVKTVIDLGCGDGSFVYFLSECKKYGKLAGMDVSAKNIETARKRFGYPFFHSREFPEFFIGSLTYRDKRMIEHFKPERMDSVLRNILGEAGPKLFVMTTPNKAYNREFNFLESGELRHPDHRHEFDETEFAVFCEKYAAMFGYKLEIAHIGEEISGSGSPILMAIFKKCA